MTAQSIYAESKKAFLIRLPYWSIALLLLAVVEFVGFVADGFAVSGDTIQDADTLMRLTYLRDGSWHTGFFARNNAPYGMVLHWTLPFNLLIVGLSKLFFFLSPDMALHYAGYWTDPILRVAIGIFAYWAARRIVSPASAAFAAILILFSPFVLNYADRGSANHHVLLYLDTVIMAGLGFALAKRPDNLKIATLAGAMTGFCLWCSFELVILAAPLCLLLFYCWIEKPERIQSLIAAAASFAAITGLAVILDPPYGGLEVIVFDHVSLAFATLSSLPLIIGLSSLAFPLTTIKRRILFFSIAGTIAAAAWVACYPSVLGGVEGAMTPYVRKEWLSNINEIAPIRKWRMVLLYLGTGILSLPLTFICFRGWRWKLTTFFFFAALCGMAEMHYRFAGYLAIPSALFLAYCLDQQRGYRLRLRLGNVIAILLVLVFYGNEAASSIFYLNLEQSDNENDGFDCNPYTVKDALNDKDWLQAGSSVPIIANDIDMAPEILYWTQARTLAGDYHRDNAGIEDSYRFFRDMGDKTPHTIVTKRNIEFVLICADGSNVGYSFTTTAKGKTALKNKNETYTPEQTLYTRLANEDPPSWLKLRDWPEEIKSDLLLYQVDTAP